MCLFQRPPSPPPPPPLPPPPPAPTPPPEPTPAPEPLVDDVNPKVRRTKSKKEQNPNAVGTGPLRIPLNPVNTGTPPPPPGGVNTNP